MKISDALTVLHDYAEKLNVAGLATYECMSIKNDKLIFTIYISSEADALADENSILISCYGVEQVEKCLKQIGMILRAS